jgi:hypothetical protein
LNGSRYNGAFNEYVHLANDSAAIFVGSVVNLTATLAASGAESEFKLLPVCAIVTPGTFAGGVCVGVKPITADSTRHCAASTLRTIYVVDDPTLIFRAQEDATGGAIAAASAGLNANWTSESGSTTTGQSTQEIDSSDVATDTTGGLRLLRLVETPTNVRGATSAPLTQWEVMIAEHQFMQDVLQLGTDI